MTEKYTVEQTLAWLDKAVEDRGADFHYRKAFGRPEPVWQNDTQLDERDNRPVSDCRYVEFDQFDMPTVPGCIVGLVCHYAGVPMVQLRRYEGSTAIHAVVSFGFDTDSRAVLSAAQTAQDGGKTWGEAVEAAKAKAEKLVRERAEKDQIEAAYSYTRPYRAEAAA